MEHALVVFLFILFLVIIISIVNEKVFKIPNDIALVLFAFVLSVIFKILSETGLVDWSDTVVGNLQSFDFEGFLMDGII